MANAEKITELIDDKALEQWERFVDSLSKAQTDMSKAAETAMSLNKSISKSTGAEDFDKKANAAAKAVEDLARKRAAAAIAEERLLQAQMRTADMVAKKAEKQAAEEEKVARAKAHSASVAARVAKMEEKQAEQSAINTSNLATNEADLARAREANAAAAISAQRQYSESIKQTTAAVTEMASASSENNDVLTAVSGSFETLVRQGLELRSELKGVQEEIKNLDAGGSSGLQRLAEQELELKAALQETTLELRRSSKERNLAESSSDQLSVRLDRLRAAWRGLSAEERDNTEVGKELEKQINALDKEMKALDARIGVTNRNVGNYKSGTEELTNAMTSQFPVLNTLKREFEGYTSLMTASIGSLKAYVNGTNAATGATKKTTAATKLFRLALISTGIGAIVVVLGSLIAYLTTTAEGMDRLTAVTRPLQQVFQALLGLLQNFGKALVDAITNPRKAWEDFKNFVDTSVMPTIKNVRDILEGIATINFSRVKDGFSGIANSVKDTGQQVNQFFGTAIASGQEVDRLKKEIHNTTVSLKREEAELNRTINEGREIARDQSKSAAERKKASEEAMQAANRLESLQISLQEKKIALLKEENKFTAESHSYQIELAEAESELDTIRARAAQNRIRLTSNYNRSVQSGETTAQKAQRERERQARIQQSLTERQIELTAQLFGIEEERANRSASNHKRIADDERENIDTRMDNLMLYLDEREKGIAYSYEKEAMEITSRLAEATKLEAIGRKEEADVIRQIVESETIALAESRKQLELELATESKEAMLKLLQGQISEEYDLRHRGLQKEAQQREQALAESYKNGEIHERDYQLAKLKLSEEMGRRALEMEIEELNKIIEANKQKGIAVGAEEKKLADLKMRLSKQASDVQIKDAERVRNEEEKYLEQRKEMQKEIGEELMNLTETLFMRRYELENQRLAKEMEDLTLRSEREKESIENSTLAEEEKSARLFALESKTQAQREQLEERQRQNQKRQARAQKAFAIMQAVTNTAMGVVRAFADWPFPASGIIAGLVGALGAVQIATIAAQPIPQFFRGTSFSPEGIAQVGEKGTELIRYPDGSEALTPNRASYTWLPKGSEILTNEQTKRYLAKQAINSAIGGGGVSKDYDSGMYKQFIAESRRSTTELKNTFKKHSSSVSITREGFFVQSGKSSQFRDYLNRNGLR